jgi:hypothetical protein
MSERKSERETQRKVEKRVIDLTMTGGWRAGEALSSPPVVLVVVIV